jgi:predicted ester cyclase
MKRRRSDSSRPVFAADGDHVFVRWRARGTHRGDCLGRPAIGRPVDFRGMTWLTFRNGLIVEGWDSWNLGELLESLK